MFNLPHIEFPLLLQVLRVVFQTFRNLRESSVGIRKIESRSGDRVAATPWSGAWSHGLCGLCPGQSAIDDGGSTDCGATWRNTPDEWGDSSCSSRWSYNRARSEDVRLKLEDRELMRLQSVRNSDTDSAFGEGDSVGSVITRLSWDCEWILTMRRSSYTTSVTSSVWNYQWAAPDATKFWKGAYWSQIMWLIKTQQIWKRKEVPCFSRWTICYCKSSFIASNSVY
jgi:hypothetical protein